MTEATTDTDAVAPSGYRIATVEERTGIGAAALRKWEDRYGFPRPARTPGGHRSYTEDDVQDLLRVKQWMDRGLPVSSAVARLRAGGAEAPPRGPAQAAADLEVTLLAGDTEAADRIVADAFAMYRFETVVHEVFAPALRSIGEGWLAGRVSVAQEHVASAYVRARLERLLGYGARRRGSAVLVTTPPGERHEIGALVIACLLHRAGHVVHYFGPDTPIDDLGPYVSASGANAVVLSATLTGPLARVPDGAYAALNVDVFVGGQALLEDPTHAVRLGADVVEDANDLLRRLGGMPASAAPARTSP